jgi:DNA-nicking Smr family endonuclease
MSKDYNYIGKIPMANDNDKDLEVWEEYVKNIKPLKKPKTHDINKPDKTPKPIPNQPSNSGRKPMKKPPIDYCAPTERPIGSHIGLDDTTRRKMNQGKYPIDYVLDLHGMTTVVAFDALYHAITRSYEQKQRMILVITGKGTNSEGVLRKMLPTWLNHDLLRDKVLRFTHASPKHGGAGAFYVLLRRGR